MTIETVETNPFVNDGLTSSKPVAYWNSPTYDPESTSKDTPFQMDVCDQRETNGQLFVDMGATAGEVNDFMGVTLEINKITEDSPETPCAHLHFDGDNLAASFFKMNDHFLVRLETDVSVEFVTLPDGSRGLKIS